MAAVNLFTAQQPPSCCHRVTIPLWPNNTHTQTLSSSRQVSPYLQCCCQTEKVSYSNGNPLIILKAQVYHNPATLTTLSVLLPGRIFLLRCAYLPFPIESIIGDSKFHRGLFSTNCASGAFVGTASTQRLYRSTTVRRYLFL